MVDAKHIAESVLKLMGIHPLIDRLMDIATEVVMVNMVTLTMKHLMESAIPITPLLKMVRCR